MSEERGRKRERGEKRAGKIESAREREREKENGKKKCAREAETLPFMILSQFGALDLLS